MTPAVITLFALAAGAYLLTAAGPLLLARRGMSPTLERAATLLPAALLAAPVITSTAATEQRIVVDAHAPALLVAAGLLWIRAPFVVVVLGAAVTAAAVRALI